MTTEYFATFVKSYKGNKLLRLNDEYNYRKKSTHKMKSYWKCVKNETAGIVCQAKLQVLDKTNPPVIISMSGQHNHGSMSNKHLTDTQRETCSGTNISSGLFNNSRPTNTSVMHSQATVLKAFTKAIPPLTFHQHKGQAGRIGVIGGSEEYTGAPYFAGITALKVGADLSYVFCCKAASPVIKSYSPELIVLPFLDQNKALESIKEWLPRLHAVVVGPGLGRVPAILEVVKDVILYLKTKDTPIVIDADGLFLITQDPTIIRGYKKAILTPNVIEFNRLFSALNLQNNENTYPDTLTRDISETTAMSKAMGDITIVRKGSVDIIANGDEVVLVKEQGSPRRCGGQGDVLSGALAVFSHWTHQSATEDQSEIPAGLAASFGACVLTRKCATQAFIQHQRATTTTDIISEISLIFQNVFEEGKL